MPADILRDQEAASPDFGALATAAGPAPAPVIKTSTPDFDAGANLQKTKLDLDAQREQQAQLQAQEFAVRDQAAQNSAQGAQNATAAIQAKQPQVDTAMAGVQQAQQAYEGQAQPPSRQLTDFLSPVAGESPENTISKLIHGISLIATGWTGLARGDATAALASLSGALKGWHEGDKVRADRAFADWKAKSDKLLADWEMRHKTAQDIFENTKLTTEQQLKMFELSRVASGDQISAAASRTQGVDQAIKSLQQEQKLWGEMDTAAKTLAQAKEGSDLDREIKRDQMAQTERLTLMKYAADLAPQPTEVDRLRDDFTKAAGPFVTIRDSYQRIQASAKDPSAAGDLALIFNYMKMLDPLSVVRESEFAAAAATGSYGDRMQALVNRAMSGERLAEPIRKDFVDRADRLFETALKTHTELEGQYKGIARQRGFDESRGVPDLVGRMRGQKKSITLPSGLTLEMD